MLRASTPPLQGGGWVGDGVFGAGISSVLPIASPIPTPTLPLKGRRSVFMRLPWAVESGGNFVESLCAKLHAAQEKRIMELELYSALQEAGVSEEKAKAVVESVKKEIDQRYSLHSKQLATQGDVEKVRADIEKVRMDVEKVRAELKIEIANTKTDVIKWNVGAIIAAVGLFATIAKIMGT
jgi:hypothetical protein